jgi:DNA-directed RNA polymerase specialized sigma24 family protein
VNQPDATPPPGADRDAETIELLRRGDAEGIRRLLHDHGGAVLVGLRRAFGRFLGDSEVEEAAGAALVRIWRSSAGTPPPSATLRSWWFVSARNCGLSIVRRRRRQKERSLDDLAEVLSVMAPTRSEQERLRRVADVHHCLRELAPMQRAVLQADLDANGTADAQALARDLCTTPRVIWVARNRGRAELRRMMQRLGHYLDEPGLGPAPSPAPGFG